MHNVGVLPGGEGLYIESLTIFRCMNAVNDHEVDQSRFVMIMF